MGLDALRHPDKGDGMFNHRFNVMEQVADKVIEAYTDWQKTRKGPRKHARLLKDRARFSKLAEEVSKMTTEELKKG